MTETPASSSPAPTPDLSVVIPVMNEEDNVETVAHEVADALASLEYEVIFVDDGSTDGTFERLRALASANPRVRALRFRRNAGKASAYDAGFRASRGRAIATLDGDGQDDPRDLLPMTARLGPEADLVVGWRRDRRTSLVYTVLSPLSNALFRASSRCRLHDLNCPVRVMRRDVALALDLRADLHRYVPLLAAARGFRVAEQPVNNRPRRTGASKYTPWKYPTSVVSFVGVLLHLRFGQRPMALFGSLGLLCLVLGFLVEAISVGRFLIFDHDIDDDIPTLILGVMLLVIGTQFLALGVLAEMMLRQLGLVGPGRSYDIVDEC